MDQINNFNLNSQYENQQQQQQQQQQRSNNSQIVSQQLLDNNSGSHFNQNFELNPFQNPQLPLNKDDLSAEIVPIFNQDNISLFNSPNVTFQDQQPSLTAPTFSQEPITTSVNNPSYQAFTNDKINSMNPSQIIQHLPLPQQQNQYETLNILQPQLQQQQQPLHSSVPFQNNQNKYLEMQQQQQQQQRQLASHLFPISQHDDSQDGYLNQQQIKQEQPYPKKRKLSQNLSVKKKVPAPISISDYNTINNQTQENAAQLSSQETLPDNPLSQSIYHSHSHNYINNENNSYINQLSVTSPDIDKRLLKLAGQMLMVGIGDGEEGKTGISLVKELIKDYGVGNIILPALYMKDAQSTRQLILELQQHAKDSGHEYPLMIAIDQENGMLNNLKDDNYITQFPGSMGIVATHDTKMAKKVAKASGEELKALGINWILGPVVDVLTNSTNRLLGVRTMGDDPEEVTRYALSYLEGYREAGISTCIKHFPGYGNAHVDSTLSLPVVYDTLEQLETTSLVPFKEIIKKGIDSVMVGSCALPKITMKDEMHACLSERVVTGMLREKLGFKGVIVSECLEMKTIFEDVGVRQGAVMAALAGCDVIIVCSSYKLQKEALSGIQGALRDKVIAADYIQQSVDRITKMKSHLSWEEALNPKPLHELKELHKKNEKLAKEAYEKSITVLRDHAKYIPLTDCVDPDATILLLTPLVSVPQQNKRDTPNTTNNSKGQKLTKYCHLSDGEKVFIRFGEEFLFKLHRGGKVLHTSYTSKGLSTIHEELIGRAKAVIIVTADASRNSYQIGFAKQLGIMCTQQRKPLIAIAASNPYDLALDRGIGTYMCLYEFTKESLEAAARVLFGHLKPTGVFPGTKVSKKRNYLLTKTNTRSVRPWLVEKFQSKYLTQLGFLWHNNFPERTQTQDVKEYLQSLLETLNSNGREQTHFIVQNSSTNQLYGFCATWVYEDPILHTKLGSILMILVHTSRRSRAIGQSLHSRALQYLIEEEKVTGVRLGARVPAFFEGIPLSIKIEKERAFSGQFQLSNSSLSSKDSTETGSSTSSIPSENQASPAQPTRTLSMSGPPLFLNQPKNYNPIDLVEWFRHVGWDIPRLAKDTVHHMEISNLHEWSMKDLHDEFSSKIEVRPAGENDRKKILELAAKEFTSTKTAGLYELYRYVLSNSNTIVMIAVMPSNTNNQGETKNSSQQVLGAAIIFSRNSPVGKYYMPWILESVNARVGGMCGLLLNNGELLGSSSSSSSEKSKENISLLVSKLIGISVQTLKNASITKNSESKYDSCSISGIEGHYVDTLKALGFKETGRFLEVYKRKEANNTV